MSLSHAETYLAEKRLLLPVLRGGNEELWQRAAAQIGFEETGNA